MYLKQKKKYQKKNKKKRSEKIKDDNKKFIKFFENESKGITYDLFKNYLDFVVPSALAKKIIRNK